MSIKVGGRAKGQSAVAAAAYRAGDKLLSEETGIISDYTNKSGVIYSEISLCENAPLEYMNREILWNAVHKIEKSKDAQLWREIEVALPKELKLSEQIETVKKFVNTLTEKGMCADWSLHDKGTGNPHAHIMLTMRSINQDGSWAPKSKKIYDLDSEGNKVPIIDKKTGLQKVDAQNRRQWKNHKANYNDWNSRENAEIWRKSWADFCNARLKKENMIDHRSYERQGLDIIPTIHEGYTARQINAKGLISERVRQNEEIQKKNKLIKQLANKLAMVMTELTKIIEQKGNIDDGKRRLSELFARRDRTIDVTGRNLADRERTATEQVDTANNEDQIIEEFGERIAQIKRNEEQQRLAYEAERKRKSAEELARREREAAEEAERQSWRGMSR